MRRDHATAEVPIPLIQEHERGRRPLRSLAELQRSIEALGLLNPITVTKDLVLVAGQHRLEACRALGWATIPATIVELSDLDAELAEIDENLIRHELHYTERGDLLARRKELYEAQHPETRHGGARGKAGGGKLAKDAESASFAADTGARMGISRRAISDDVRIATKASPELKAALVACDVPKVEALKAIRLPPSAQWAVATMLLDGAKPAEAIKETRSRLPRPTYAAAPAAPAGVLLAVADACALPLPAECVDLVLTSPPYALAKEYASGGDVPAELWAAFMRAWLAEAFRVTRTNGGRLALNVPLDTCLPFHRAVAAEATMAALAAGWTYRTTVLWDKGHSTRGNCALGSCDSAAAPHPIAEVEVVALFSKGSWRKETPGVDDISHAEWRGLGNGLWRFPGEMRAWERHPAPFPLELPRRLITYLTYVGDTVLDPFLGSGTAGVAARDLERRFLGFDRAAEYVASSLRRLAAAGAS